MNKFDMKALAEKQNNEYVLGSADTGSHACYMIYGTLKPGEKGREIKPGKGHEEMLLSARGSFNVTGDFEGIIEEGSAIHIRAMVGAALQSPDPEAAFNLLAQSAGLTGTDLPTEMAFINEVLDALPDSLCNVFLVNYFNDLYV